MDARDYFGPANKCRNCYRICTKNLNGTWSTHCSVCKERQNRYKQRKSAVTLEDSEPDDDAPLVANVPNCAGCDNKARPNKGGSGWTKYCHDCQEDTSAIFKAIWALKTKRRLAEQFDLEGLQAKKAKLEHELVTLQEKIEEAEEINEEVEKAASDLTYLL